jgi:hypothetical protein
LAERAVSVVTDRALEERRWSTPDLLAVEQQLVTAAISRTGEHTAVASHEAVRDALAAIPLPDRTSRPWSGTCARAAKGSPWLSGSTPSSVVSGLTVLRAVFAASMGLHDATAVG